jgi:multidrug transporter EmrE-like cation transporter
MAQVMDRTWKVSSKFYILFNHYLPRLATVSLFPFSVFVLLKEKKEIPVSNQFMIEESLAIYWLRAFFFFGSEMTWKKIYSFLLPATCRHDGHLSFSRQEAKTRLIAVYSRNWPKVKNKVLSFYFWRNLVYWKENSVSCQTNWCNHRL